MWACPFCNKKNESNSDNCAQCGAHTPVQMQMAEIKRLVKKPRARIAGLRGWVFSAAGVCFCIAAICLDRAEDARAIVRQYDSSCLSSAAVDSAPVCVKLPASYTIGSLASPGQMRIVEVTPQGQSTLPISMDAERLPSSGQGTAVFWNGRLTTLSTSYGSSDTVLSPIFGVRYQQSLFFNWLLVGLCATILPFAGGFALRFEYEIAEESKRET